MNLQQLKTEFKSGRITKPEYIDRMHEKHRALFEYAEFIKDTDIKLIEIAGDSVVMTTRSHGIKLICDKDDKRIIPVEMLNFDYYEKEDLDMMLALIDDGFSVFDIGGNIGWFAITVAKLRQSTKVLTFEPIPKTFGYLTSNLALNGVNNVHPHNFGFSSQKQELTFFYYPEGSGNASSANLSSHDSVQQITCQVKKLDDFVAENNLAVDFIKCDVEGAELLVFQGGMETVIAHRPIIFAELLRKWASKFNYHPNEVIRLLKGAGYRCFTARDKALAEFHVMDDDTVETNFFFLHAEKHAALINRLVKTI